MSNESSLDKFIKTKEQADRFMRDLRTCGEDVYIGKDMISFAEQWYSHCMSGLDKDKKIKSFLKDFTDTLNKKP